MLQLSNNLTWAQMVPVLFVFTVQQDLSFCQPVTVAEKVPVLVGQM